jgi:hypothetical protein
MEDSFRSHLQDSVSASAAPYGYALVIFSTGSVADYVIGRPHVLEVLLFLAGGVLAFLLCEIGAYGRPLVRLRSQAGGPMEAWGHAHLLSAAAAVMASWALLQLVPSDLGWLVVGFSSTAVYLLLNAGQTLLASLAVPAERSVEDVAEESG